MHASCRSLIAGIFLAALAACGGSSSPDSAGPPAIGTGPGASPVPVTPGTPGTTPAPGNDGGNAPAVNTLPQLHIQTEGRAAVANTEDYLNATLRVVSESGSELMQVPTEIRGRGNSTWAMPKKPYRLKLNTAASMFGMPAERDWALLANYADKSMVRNKLAMNLGERLGLAYNPRSRFVELYFNDAYQGVYQLFEHVKVGPNRVNVTKLNRNTDTAADAITGGYFLEADQQFGEDVCWLTSMRVPICAKDPEYVPADIANTAHPSHAQFNYISGYVNAAEQAIATPGNAYAQYFDPDAMVNWYLVMELMKNHDAQINGMSPNRVISTSSVFLHKQRGGRLTFGPLWDFDIAAGNINYNGNDDPTGWYIRDSVWYAPLFAHSDFGRRVFAKWCDLRSAGIISGLGAEIDAIVAGIDRNAIDRNFRRWNILGTYVWPNAFVGNTYDEEVNYLKTWMTTRADWMNAEYVREFGECPAVIRTSDAQPALQ